MIPRVIHTIWVGDESKRPDNCIATWRDKNPGWQLKVWGNKELAETPWVTSRHMQAMAQRELNGVADLMRWEILWREGGFVVDADSICQRPLEPWLFECDAMACWENEVIRPGLIAAGYVAAAPRNPFFAKMVQDLMNLPQVDDRMAWQSVGPLFLTECHRLYQYDRLTIWPSHFFIPRHFSSEARYGGRGHVFADQEWGSTLGTYDELHKKAIAA